jgi:hypothetical protein
MRRLALLLVVVAACRDGEPPPAAPVPVPDAAPIGELTLPPLTVRVGDVAQLEAEISVSAKVRLYRKGKFGGYLTLSVSHRRVTRAEVLDGGRVRVTYDTNRMTDVATRSERALPVEGKSYLFDARGVTTEGGAAVPADEDAIVRRDAASVLSASPLAQLVAGRTLTLGRQEDAPAEALARAAAGAERYSRLGWIYKGKRGPAPILAWTGATDEEWPNGLVLRANLVGEVVLDPVTGVALEATHDGPVTVEMIVKQGSKTETYIGTGRLKAHIVKR